MGDEHATEENWDLILCAFSKNIVLSRELGPFPSCLTIFSVEMLPIDEESSHKEPGELEWPRLKTLGLSICFRSRQETSIETSSQFDQTIETLINCSHSRPFHFCHSYNKNSKMSSTPTKFSGAVAGGPVESEQRESSVSGKAIGSLVCAILGLFILGVVLGPVAICLGVSANNDIKEQPGVIKGECMATSGIVIGTISFVLSVVVIAIIASG